MTKTQNELANMPRGRAAVSLSHLNGKNTKPTTVVKAARGVNEEVSIPLINCLNFMNIVRVYL